MTDDSECDVCEGERVEKIEDKVEDDDHLYACGNKQRAREENNMGIDTNIYCACCNRFSKARVFFDDLGNVQQSTRCVPQSVSDTHAAHVIYTPSESVINSNAASPAP